MKSITKDYLLDIIFRRINKTIVEHRQSKRNYMLHEDHPRATEEELLEFIHSIPYFDTKLKDFIIGHLSERTIIVSQSWENEFILKCNAWAESYEWLEGDDRFLSDKHLDDIKRSAVALTLPY
ncbi:hypothetical protein BH11BAC4_BH11BAC4_00380 [soil metagenome]